MFQPKAEKYRKKFRGKMRGSSQRANRLSMGEYGLKALSRGWISARQIESARKTIASHTKRKGKLWVRVFPDKSYTRKPAEVKMGGGKGDIDGYVAVVKPGRVVFELGGIEKELAEEALRRAGHKLPIKSKFVVK